MQNNLDMISANSPTAIGADRLNAQVKTPNVKWHTFHKATKESLAKKIIALVQTR